MFTLLTAATAAVVSTTPPVGGLFLAAIGLKALSDAAEISRDAREHDSDRRTYRYNPSTGDLGLVCRYCGKAQCSPEPQHPLQPAFPASFPTAELPLRRRGGHR